MPRYDYHCPACDNTFELTQSFDSEPAADCPVCGSSARRLISHPAIHFKGSGFYVTDNRSKKSTTRKPTEKQAEKSETSTSKAESTSSGESSKSSGGSSTD